MSGISIFSITVAVVTIGAVIMAILGAAFPSKITISIEGVRITKIGFLKQEFNWNQLSKPYLSGMDIGGPRLRMDVLHTGKKVVFSPPDYCIGSKEMLNIFDEAKHGKLASASQIDSARIGNVGWKVGATFLIVIALRVVSQFWLLR